jgi:hypothetical protein
VLRRKGDHLGQNTQGLLTFTLSLLSTTHELSRAFAPDELEDVGGTYALKSDGKVFVLRDEAEHVLQLLYDDDHTHTAASLLKAAREQFYGITGNVTSLRSYTR